MSSYECSLIFVKVHDIHHFLELFKTDFTIPVLVSGLDQVNPNLLLNIFLSSQQILYLVKGYGTVSINIKKIEGCQQFRICNFVLKLQVCFQEFAVVYVAQSLVAKLFEDLSDLISSFFRTSKHLSESKN
jgi:hypothetical protein